MKSFPEEITPRDIGGLLGEYQKWERNYLDDSADQYAAGYHAALLSQMRVWLSEMNEDYWTMFLNDRKHNEKL